MTENSQIPVYVKKADMAVSDLNSGGALVRDQLKRFLLVNIKSQYMFQKVRVTTMSRESQEISKMTTFGSQVWYPGTESQALSLAQRVKPGFDKVTLTSQEIVCQVDFPRYTLKAQVEGPRFKNTMIAYLGRHTGRGFENIIINGDTTSSNTFLAMADGIIASTSTYAYDASGASLSSTILKGIRLTLPSEFRSQSGLAYFTNDIAWSAYDDELAARGTQLGDDHQTNMPALRYKGRQVHEVPMFPNDLGVGSNYTATMHMDPKNWIFAFHERMEMQTEYNIRERVWTVVITARFAQDYEHEPMAVRGYSVLGQ